MSLLAVVLISAAVWFAVPPRPDPRLDALFPRPGPPSQGTVSKTSMSWLGSSAAAAGALFVLPAPGNVLVAGGCLLLLPRLIGRMESRSDRRRRDALARQGPVVVDLLAATLASGAAMRSALAAVSVAVEDPAAGILSNVVAAMDLGADPVEAWAAVEHDPILGALAEAVVRSARTGAPLSSLLSRLAEDMRRERRAVVEVAARTAGVRAVIPLIACFLPAFILLGVVPVVAALANELLGT